jgi:hypothetical protein
MKESYICIAKHIYVYLYIYIGKHLSPNFLLFFPISIYYSKNKYCCHFEMIWVYSLKGHAMKFNLYWVVIRGWKLNNVILRGLDLGGDGN